jgi:hypothetical protein
MEASWINSLTPELNRYVVAITGSKERPLRKIVFTKVSENVGPRRSSWYSCFQIEYRFSAYIVSAISISLGQRTVQWKHEAQNQKVLLLITWSLISAKIMPIMRRGV